MVLDRMLMILHDYRVVYLNDDLIFVFIYNLTRIVCIYNIEWMMVFIQKPHMYCEVNIACLLFLLLVFFRSRSATYFSRLYHAIIVLCCLIMVSDCLWGIADNTGAMLGSQVRKIIYLSYYLISGLTCYLWYVYSDKIWEPHHDRKRAIIGAMPLVILYILMLATMKTGWVFYVDSTDTYRTGPLYAAAVVLTYGYLVVAEIKALILSRTSASYMQRQRYAAVASFGLPVLIAGVIQEIFAPLPILCVGITFAVLYVFFSFKEQQISVDGLTGINNYNRFMQQLSECMAHKNKDGQTYLFMMDMDHFKSINDTYGHVEGDNALKTVADALKACCDDGRYFIARYGGDEFAAICSMKNKDEAERFSQSIKSELQKKSSGYSYDLLVSIGYAVLIDSMHKESDFIRYADAALYREKIEIR